MTKAEVIAALPERFQKFDIEGPWESLEMANLMAAYHQCRYKELLKAFQTLLEKYS